MAAITPSASCKAAKERKAQRKISQKNRQKRDRKKLPKLIRARKMINITLIGGDAKNLTTESPSECTKREMKKRHDTSGTRGKIKN